MILDKWCPNEKKGSCGNSNTAAVEPVDSSSWQIKRAVKMLIMGKNVCVAGRRGVIVFHVNPASNDAYRDNKVITRCLFSSAATVKLSTHLQC